MMWIFLVYWRIKRAPWIQQWIRYAPPRRKSFQFRSCFPTTSTADCFKEKKKSYFPPYATFADACAGSLPNVRGFLEAEFHHCGIPGSQSSFFCSRSADLRLCLFALEWEEQLLCKQAVLHLDVTVHENSSAESAVTSLADPVRWSVCASVTA